VKADLTRDSFDIAKNFSRVLMQQGRVQLDADWNEQAAILLHLLRRLAADAFGPSWSPDGGFIPQTLSTTKAVPDDIWIAPGSIYVDGILCEIEATHVAILSWDTVNNAITVAQWTVDDTSFQVGQYLQLWDNSVSGGTTIVCRITKTDYLNLILTVDSPVAALATAAAGRARRLVTYAQQPNLPAPPTLKPGVAYQLYLDVWERLITSIEDDSIREVALNGADTAARTKVIWQVKALANQATCLTPQQLVAQLQPWNTGLLRARVQPAQVSTDPCAISPDSAYRGPENQLYRVEIHTGSNDPSGLPPSFKFSRENGSAVYPLAAPAVPGSGSMTVTLGNLGRDDRFGLAVGDWVELQDDESVLANISGSLLQVQSIDRTALQVVLSGATTAGIGTDMTLHPLLRRWDHKAGDPATGGLTIGKDGAVPIPLGQPAVWVDLEDGVQVRFEEVAVATFRTSDYWFIPARVATGQVIWPSETGTDAQGKPVVAPVAKPTDGVEHHYVPLAIVTANADGASLPQIQLCFGNDRVRPAPVAPRPVPAPTAPRPQ
jgi:hypothetical protein